MSWRQWLERSLLGLLASLLLLCLGDWVLWRARLASGGDAAGYGNIRVTRMVVAPLKGNREEYYPDGTEQERCTHSLLPWSASGACWWIARSPIVFER